MFLGNQLRLKDTTTPAQELVQHLTPPWLDFLTLQILHGLNNISQNVDQFLYTLMEMLLVLNWP